MIRPQQGFADVAFGIRQKTALLECVSFRKRLLGVYQRLDLVNPAINLQRASQRLGVAVVVDPLLPSRGQISTNSRGKRIIHLRHHPTAGHPRFTLAHELAHEIVRQDLLALEGATADCFTMDDIEEEFCDFVAGLLVMPLRLFFPRVHRLALRFPRLASSLYRTLANDFRVSLEATLVQIALLQSFHFVYETYEYGALVPTLPRIAEQVPNRRVYSGRWQVANELALDCDAHRTSITAQLAPDLPEKGDELFRQKVAPYHETAIIDRRFKDPATDWSHDSGVVALERTGRSTELRHILRPVTNSPYLPTYRAA